MMTSKNRTKLTKGKVAKLRGDLTLLRVKEEALDKAFAADLEELTKLDPAAAKKLLEELEAEGEKLSFTAFSL